MSNSKLFLLGVVSLIVMIGLWSGVAFAVGTPAGTVITNQASATYDDASGGSHTTNSNLVYTTVASVYGLTITPDGTLVAPGQIQSAAPGATVYFSYTLTNTGNDVDNFVINIVNDGTDNFDPNNIQVYHDLDGDGIVDTGEPLIYNGAAGTVYNISADASTKLVMKYTIPVSATSGQFTRVDITGQSANDVTKTDTGNYNRTNVTLEAVLVANKSVSPTEVDPGGTLRYEIVGRNNGGSATIATSSVLTVGATNYYGVIIADPIPTKANGTPMTVSVVDYSPTGGVVLYLVGNTTPTKSDPISTWATMGTNQWKAVPAGGDVIRAVAYITGGTTSGAGAIDPGQAFNLVLNLTVPIDQPAGNIVNNGRVEYYYSGPTLGSVETNDATAYVRGTSAVGVILYPPNTKVNAHDGTSQDIERYATIAASQSATFTLTIRNVGNSTDVFNLTNDAPNNGGPLTGWTVGYYEMDGVTPIGDSDLDGNPDIRVVAGGTASFKLKVTVPGNQTPLGANTDIVVYATSKTDASGTFPLAFNTTSTASTPNGSYYDVTLGSVAGVGVGSLLNFTVGGNNEVARVLAISGSKVTVALSGNADVGGTVTGLIIGKNQTTVGFVAVTGAGVEYYNNDNGDAHPGSTARAFNNQTAGTYVDMPVYVYNTGAAWDVYSLSETLPANWSVVYYKETGNYGTLDPGEMTPVNSVGVNPGVANRVRLIARVFIHSTATPTGSPYNVDLRVTSNNNSAITDVINNTVSIAQNLSLVFSPNRSAQGIPGNTVAYLHTLTNNGNVNIPATTTYFTVASDHNWASDYVVYQYVGASWVLLNKSGANWELNTAVTPGSSTQIQVVFYVPTSAPEGAVETATITVYHGANTAITDFVYDVTTIYRSSLMLTKKVAEDANNDCAEAWTSADITSSGKPTQSQKYFVQFKNVSTQTVSVVIIQDAVPPNTKFVVGSAGVDPGSITGTGVIEVAYSNDGGSTWTYTPVAGADGTDSNVTNIQFKYTNGSGTAVDLLPGESGRVKFCVKIK